MEKIKVAVDQPLGADDPKTERGQAEQNGVMHDDAETHRDQIEQHHSGAGRDLKLHQRNDYHYGAKKGIEHTVEAELLGGDGKLTVNRQHQERVEFPGANQLRDVRDVHEEKGLE